MADQEVESPLMAKIREYMMGHGGLAGADNKQYDIAMGVDPSSGTTKGYAAGGVVTPDLGDVPIPGQTPPQTNVPQGTMQSPIQDILAQSQGLGAKMAGQYTPEMRNQLYAAMVERQNSLPNAIGSTLASAGDAIAHGYGRDQTNFLQNTLQGQKQTRDEGMGAFDTAQKMNMAQTGAGMDLGKMDPTSALSKAAQEAYSGPLSKLGYKPEQIAKMPASSIESVAQVALKYGDIEAQKELKEATLQLQSMLGNATIRNQQKEREQAAKNAALDANKEAAKHWLTHPIDAMKAQKAIAAAGQDTGAPAAAATSTGPVKVNSTEEYKALPSGTHYVDSYGTEKVKK